MLHWMVSTSYIIAIPRYYNDLFLGSYHSILMTYCPCETEVETLLRLHLFPATPKHPQLAFTFKFLDWLEALLLECHVSVHDFVASVKFLSDNKLLQV